MCYETKCSTCGKRSWGGCGKHVASVYKNIPEDQRCQCKAWPVGDSQASSSTCTIM